MNPHTVLTSVTRISDLAEVDFEVIALDRKQWATGDFVAASVLDISRAMRLIELPNGRMAEISEGDVVIGAFGGRAATLGAVGNWQDIGPDGHIDALTSAGLFGKMTSNSPFAPVPTPLAYHGHVCVGGDKRTMFDYAFSGPLSPLTLPVFLIVGTSMSAGKTTSARLIIRLLREMNLKVAAAKLTGAARYRDILSFADVGAAYIFDFVDVGLPSTVCDADIYTGALEQLLSTIEGCGADVLVVEAGASPLEPYNGAAAVEFLGQVVRFTMLCASDPYAVLGVTSAFGIKPDLVAGGAANTTAGIDLVRNLTGLACLDIFDRRAGADLKDRLAAALADTGA
jgi:hypothetical protein